MAASAAMDVGKSLRMLTQPPARTPADRRLKRRSRVLPLLLFPLLWGCGAVLAAAPGKAPGKTFAVDGTVALFEPDVELSALIGDTPAMRPDWSATARLLFAQAALETLDRRGIHVAPGGALPLDGQADGGDASLRQHVQSVATALLQRGSQPTSPAPSLQADAETIRCMTDADYALLTWIRDGQAGRGRTALRLAGRLLIGDLGGGDQAGIAMLVDLRTGAVVWHAPLPEQTYDLRNLAGARDAADRLFKRLQDGRPAPAASP
jgi:hypothetical protein